MPTIAIEVANPLATPSASLTTIATSNPPAAWLTTTLQTNGVNPCRGPYLSNKFRSDERNTPAKEKQIDGTESCKFRAQSDGLLSLNTIFPDARFIGLFEEGELRVETGESD